MNSTEANDFHHPLWKPFLRGVALGGDDFRRAFPRPHPNGLSPSALLVFAKLFVRGSTTVPKLERETGLNRATVNRAVNVLKDRGWVSFDRIGQRGTLFVELTPGGRREAKRIMEEGFARWKPKPLAA